MTKSEECDDSLGIKRQYWAVEWEMFSTDKIFSGWNFSLSNIFDRVFLYT